MTDRHETKKVSEVLWKELMEPNGISAKLLAQEIELPVSIIESILEDERRMNADLSVRLGFFFGISEMYFQNLQMEMDLNGQMDDAMAILGGMDKSGSDPE